jgi:hypothetical protein
VVVAPTLSLATFLPAPDVDAIAVPVNADALAAADVGVVTIDPIALLADVASVVDGVVLLPDVVCCTLLTKARICAELVVPGSLPLVELEVLLDVDLPVLPFAPVLEPVPLLELVPDVDPLEDDVDDVEDEEVDVDEADEDEDVDAPD